MRASPRFLRRASIHCLSVWKVMAVVFVAVSFVGSAAAQETNQKAFGSPEEAAQALVDACAANDVGGLLAILGHAGRELISSGDEVADKAGRARLATAFQDMHKLVPEGQNKQVLHIGVEDWQLPIPIVKRGDLWQFETIEGAQDLLRRRISSNQSSAIRVCRLYVNLQEEYARRYRDPNTSAGLYAQKIMSDPGKHNGLYWKVEGGGERSPAGSLVELAVQEGYARPGERPKPFHGYYFRVLTAQGKDAPGGAKSYFAGNDIGYFAEKKMTGGFALVAYPAKYQSSGVMTFIVNRDGIVYQKDLSEETAESARQMTEYNPDATWSVAE
jgi:Protein of unknown function (DUF2950)